MIDTGTLTFASALRPDDLTHWREVISAGSGYRRASIPQKRRRPREVIIPSVGLDRFLKQLRIGLTKVSRYVPPDDVHGFVKGRDIATNAAEHLNQDVVLKVDLADFFGTIDNSKLRTALETFEFDEGCTDLVAGVALIDGSLAQGFSTSPLLSNLVFLETDRALATLAERTGVRHTRYVDDLAFSGPRDLVHDSLLAEIENLLVRFGWSINRGKTRFMRRGKPQYVTGLYVGDSAGPHIPRAMKRLLRREVHFASRFGVEDARLGSPTPIENDRLGGWVHYAAHVDPVFGQRLRSVWRQVASSRSENRPGHDWDLLLDDIEFPENW